MVFGNSATKHKRKSANEVPPYTYTNTITNQQSIRSTKTKLDGGLLSPVYGAAFNPYIDDPEAGHYLATCGSRFLNIYKLYADDKRVEHMLQFQDPNKEESYYAVSWAFDRIIKRHIVLVGGAKGIIRIIDPLEKKTISTLRGHGEAVNEIRTSPHDSMIVASASKDRTARLWNIRCSDCLAIFGGANGHLDEVISLDFDIDQNYLVTASMDHTVRFFDIRLSTKVGQRIEECYNKNKIKSKPAEEVQFPLAISRDVHTNYVDCCRFLGDFIISKSCENRIVLWKFGSYDLDAAGDGTLDRTETYVLHTAQMTLPKAETWFIKFDLHPENKFLACGNESGEIHLWNLDTKKGFPENKSDFVLTIPDNRNCIRQTAFSPCGRILIAVGEIGQVVRFDST